MLHWTVTILALLSCRSRLIHPCPVVAAVGLVKRSIFRLPSSFAAVSVDNQRVFTSEVARKTLNPTWTSHAVDMYGINI